MTPLEKLREDVRYWQQQMATAREALRVGEAVLPGLEAQLRALETAAPENVPTEEEPARFSGQCAQQVLQALRRKPTQSSADLRASVRQHGRAFSRGAISYAIRDLRSKGTIVEAGRRGNLVFYRLASV